ncbi:LPXTG cell wall anchor domain-containing protein [Streptococcus hyovaginalis]
MSESISESVSEPTSELASESGQATLPNTGETNGLSGLASLLGSGFLFAAFARKKKKKNDE